LAIWLPTTKSRELPKFTYVQVACDIPSVSSRWGLQFFLRSHLHRRSTHKVMGPKFVGVPIVKISRFPFGSPMTKWHLGAGLVAKHIVYYEGEGGDFPQVRFVMSLMNPCLPMVRPCTKMLQLCTNQLVVWFVHVRVSNWCLSLFLVPS